MQSEQLDQLYRTTKDPRLRTRAQMVFLAAEQRLKVPQIAAIVAELAPRPEDVVVTKHTTSPFHTPDRGVYLRRFGMTTLILTGYSTTSVVEEALRDARDQDYECVVVRDGCAAATAQEHDTCMDLVFPRMAWVAGVDDVINAIHG